jgi:hypothetical protein
MDNAEYLIRFNEAYDKMTFDGTWFRGKIISEFLVIEYQIDEFLAIHFCSQKDRKKELFELVLQQMNFINKLTIFEKLLKKHKPDFYKTHKDMISSKDGIRWLYKYRNVLAHDLLDTTENGIKLFIQDSTVFRFYNFKNNSDLTEFTLDVRKKLLENLRLSYTTIGTLIDGIIR